MMIVACGENENRAMRGDHQGVGEVDAFSEEIEDGSAASCTEAALDIKDAAKDDRAKRTEKYGFARYLPNDVDAFITIQNLGETIQDIQQMDLWNVLKDEFDMLEMGPWSAAHDEDFSDLDGIMHEEDLAEANAEASTMELLGREVTLALGAGGHIRLGAWLEWNKRASHFQMRNLGIAGLDEDATRFLAGGPLPLMSAIFGSLSDSSIYRDLFQDGAAIQALEALRMPPLMLAVRADPERLQEVHGLISMPVRAMVNFGEMLNPLEVTRAGHAFSGFSVEGKEFAEMFLDFNPSMADILGQEGFNRLKACIHSQQWVIMSGIVDDYAVLFVGSSPEDLVLMESPESSITYGDDLGFADALLDHPQLALVHAKKEMLGHLADCTTRIADMALGLREGFVRNDPNGRNRDLIAMLQIVAERERALNKLSSHAATGMVLVNDGGPRIESQSGTSGMFDFNAPSRFADLENDPDTFMFLNLCIDDEYSSKSFAYLESLLETGYALVLRMAETHPGTEPLFDSAPFAMSGENAFMLDGVFREDLVTMWRSLVHGARSGLGGESAIIVDLKGTLPSMTGAAKLISDMPNTPRITYLAAVEDRQKLAASWSTIHESAGRMAQYLGTRMESDIPMPKAIHSEADGLKSWFLPLPFFDDEFLPSVTLNDTWFALGTSRNQSVDLIQRLDTSKPVAGGGMRFRMDFNTMVKAQEQQLAFWADRRETMAGQGETNEKEFETMTKRAQSLIRAMSFFSSLEAKCWEENGTLRSRIHLKLNEAP